MKHARIRRNTTRAFNVSLIRNVGRISSHSNPLPERTEILSGITGPQVSRLSPASSSHLRPGETLVYSTSRA